MKTTQRDTRRLNVGNYVGLKFDQGWWFFSVISNERVELKPYTLQNSDLERAPIQPGNAGNQNEQIQDRNGDNLLLPANEERNLVYHVMYGIAPSRMRVFERFGRERNESLLNYDEPGDPAPATTGFDSPYNNPTEEAEMFTLNDMSTPKLQAYNPMDEAAEARISLHVNKLRYATVEDQGLQKALLQGQVPAKLVPAGGGAQDADQVSPPGWLTETFGDQIRTTEEIYSTNTSSEGNGGSDSGRGIPDITGQIGGGQ